MSIFQMMNDSKIIGYLNGSIYASCNDLDSMINDMEVDGFDKQELFKLVFATEWLKLSYRVSQQALKYRCDGHITEDEWQKITNEIKQQFKLDPNGRTKAMVE